MKGKKMKSILYYGLVLVLSGTLVGCDKYLDQVPDMRTELNSTDKVAQLLVSAYPKADYMSFTELASDNVEDKGPSTEYLNVGNTGLAWENTYFWRDVENGGSDIGTTDFYWNACYLAIASANTALGYINDNPDDQNLQAYKGEALVARAYAHFMLVSLYAKTYEPNGDNASPGVPYVTEPERVVFEKYDRSTVAETYKRIEEDLLVGVPLIRNNIYKVPKYHFTVAAANAFAARFYLFKGDFQKVIDHAQKVYGSTEQFKANLRPWNTTYAGLAADAFNVSFTKSNQNASLLMCEAGSAWGRNFYVRYGLGQQFIARKLETSNNVARGSYSYRNFNRDPYYSLQKWNELFFETKIGSGFGDPYVMIPLLTVDELLMNRAEAYASLGQHDLALQDINAFLSTRIDDYNPTTNLVTLARIADFYKTTDSKEGLIKTILDLKQAEFVSEGLRWFDLNRHKIDIKHMTMDVNRNETTITLPANDPRRIFQVPAQVVASGIERNPR